ncbi:hypothetical protein KOW79_006750 [Hemibagrus wyckioides]|uniref:C-type lectin domain-containing protein n=1 Tax=Hemibagrus wyckioides TaxID=337641 RepID=A0A9D3ST68_9TELE|nr:lactose-binding lectin l-2-like [Hemibagrus wyckioides]KAG7330528.1 hypothetical protein KOW79_006750 [Hemibagrus wyckioides]
MACQTKVVMLLILATAVTALATDFDQIVKENNVIKGRYFANCPFGWVHYDGRCYLYQGTKLDWVAAENHCLSLDANLVSIHSENEYQLVKALIRAHGHQADHTYIGLSGCQKAFNFFWSDGTKLTFTKWNPGQPDNYGGRESCVHITNHDYKDWNDISCDHSYPFVCAKRSG